MEEKLRIQVRTQPHVCKKERKKERKKDDFAASIFGPSNHPGCDPHAPRTSELPKHTAVMQTAIRLRYTTNICFTYMTCNRQYPISATKSSGGPRVLMASTCSWYMQVIQHKGDEQDSIKKLNKTQSKNRQSKIMLSTALRRCGNNNFGRHRVRRTAGKHYSEIYSQFSQSLIGGVQ